MLTAIAIVAAVVVAGVILAVIAITSDAWSH